MGGVTCKRVQRNVVNHPSQLITSSSMSYVGNLSVVLKKRLRELCLLLCIQYIYCNFLRRVDYYSLTRFSWRIAYGVFRRSYYDNDCDNF